MSEDDRDTGEILPLPDYQSPKPRDGAILSSPDTIEVWTALVQAQGMIEPPKRTKKATVEGKTRDGRVYKYDYHYAPLEEVLSVARKPLADVGLGFQQFLAVRGGKHVVRTILFHKSGQWTSIDYPIFYDEARGAQGFASGVTYARRYGLTLTLGLAPEDDDDANLADAQQATVEEVRATRAKPAVAAADPQKDDGLVAFRSVAQAIDASDTAAALAKIYDLEHGQWGELFAAEIARVRAVGPQALEMLRARALKQHERLTEPARIAVPGLAEGQEGELLREAVSASKRGLRNYEAHWTSLKAHERVAIGVDRHEALKRSAMQIDFATAADDAPR